MQLSQEFANRFDRLVERVIDRLPEPQRTWVQAEVPVVVDDCPTDRLLADLDVSDPRELAGLYMPAMVTTPCIYLFRAGILGLARERMAIQQLAHELNRAIEELTVDDLPPEGLMIDEQAEVDDASLAAEIEVTIMHELAHHKGLDEREVEELGF